MLRGEEESLGTEVKKKSKETKLGQSWKVKLRRFQKPVKFLRRVNTFLDSEEYFLDILVFVKNFRIFAKQKDFQKFRTIFYMDDI